MLSKLKTRLSKVACLITDMVKDIPGVELVTDGTLGINVINIRGEKEGGTGIYLCRWSES